MGWKDKIIELGIAIVATMIAPKAVDIGAKALNEKLEQQKAKIKIPDLKDVHIDESLRVLKELNLIPTLAIAKPSIAYADESENKVMSSEPKFGTRVNPGTPVKVYYVTQEVIDKCKILLENAVNEFKTPKVIGLNIFEAREDLEDLGLRVSDRLDEPSLNVASMEDGQVTRITYLNNKKIGLKLKTSDRVLLFYVDDEVILKSKSLQNEKETKSKELKAKNLKFRNDISKRTVDRAKNLAQKVVKQFKKINKKPLIKEEK